MDLSNILYPKPISFSIAPNGAIALFKYHSTKAIQLNKDQKKSINNLEGENIDDQSESKKEANIPLKDLIKWRSPWDEDDIYIFIKILNEKSKRTQNYRKDSIARSENESILRETSEKNKEGIFLIRQKNQKDFYLGIKPLTNVEFIDYVCNKTRNLAFGNIIWFLSFDLTNITNMADKNSDIQNEFITNYVNHIRHIINCLSKKGKWDHLLIIMISILSFIYKNELVDYVSKNKQKDNNKSKDKEVQKEQKRLKFLQSIFSKQFILYLIQTIEYFNNILNRKSRVKESQEITEYIKFIKTLIN